MINNSIYTANKDGDHIDILHAILNLSRLGAASTDSALNVAHLLDAHRSMYETIHEIACEGVRIAEAEQRRLEAENATLKAVE